jgi:oligoribonuclease NrnB/cAMP/cGMP phosphodiesterase (DHH superfamily)
MERTGTAATRAKNKYNEKAYDRLYPYVKKGRKTVYEEAASKIGLSLNEFVIEASEEKVANVTGNEYKNYINKNVLESVLNDICNKLMEAIGDKAQLQKEARNTVKKIAELLNKT